MGGDLVVNDAQAGKLRRTVSQLGSVCDLAPAGSAAQLEGDQLRDLFDDFSEWPGAVDVFENAAAPLFDEGQTGGLPAHSVLDGPAPGADREDDQKQHADENYEVANVQQRGSGDDRNIVRSAHEDVERHLAVEWIRVLDDADAGDADSGA